MTDLALQWLATFVLSMAIGGICLPSEMLVGKRHSITGRLRAAVFWAIQIGVHVVVLELMQRALRGVGIGPLFVLDLSWLGAAWGGIAQVAVAASLSLLPGFVFDFAYYWFHRLQHAVPFLWRYHAVHHAIEELNATNCYHHWTEGLFRIPLMVLPLTLLLDLRVPELAVITNIVGAWAQFVHADSRLDFGPFRWFVVSPRFHRVHHSLERGHFDRNFAGVFPIFDMVFGTAHFPKAGDTIETGLADRREARTIGSYLSARPD